jgi:hypothetical protein
VCTYGPTGQVAGYILKKLRTGDRGVSQAWGDGMAARVAVALLRVDFWDFLGGLEVFVAAAWIPFFLTARVWVDASAEAAEVTEA